MESEFSFIRQNLPFKYNGKYYKEDLLESKKSNLNTIKNFVPVIKPKKAHRRPTPFHLNPEESLKKKFYVKKNFKESFINSFKFIDKDDLASSKCSDLSSTEKESKNEIENLPKDYSSNEKSLIFIFKEEGQSY